MKKIIVSTINVYQIFSAHVIFWLTGSRNVCRFSPTCSEYAKISISEHGIFKGGYLSIVRLLKCQPFYNAN